MAPPLIELKWDVLNALLQRGASKGACASILEISEDTIERRIKEAYNIGFTEYRERKLNATRMKLIEKAIDKALKGENVMLIFCLKNLCGWADKIENNDNSAPLTVQLKYKLDDIAETKKLDTEPE